MGCAGLLKLEMVKAVFSVESPTHFQSACAPGLQFGLCSIGASCGSQPQKRIERDAQDHDGNQLQPPLILATSYPLELQQLCTQAMSEPAQKVSLSGLQGLQPVILWMDEILHHLSKPGRMIRLYYVYL